MDAHRVEVLHIANGHAIVKAVSNDFIFDFFPSCQILLDQDLWAVIQRPAGSFLQTIVIGAESRPQPSEGICGAQHDGITNLVRCPNRILHGCYRNTLRHPNADFSEFTDEEISILCLTNRLDWSTENVNI